MLLQKSKKLTLLFVIIIFISCSSSKETPKEYNSFSDKFDINDLNGIYTNLALKETKTKNGNDFDYNSLSLSSIIFDPYVVFSESSKIQINYEGRIQIQVLNEKEIKITHIIDTATIQQTILKGKVDGNFFKIEKRNPTGIPLIWGAFRSKYIYLNLNQKDNLYVRFGASYWGGALIIFSGNENIYHTELEFKKIR